MKKIVLTSSFLSLFQDLRKEIKEVSNGIEICTTIIRRPEEGNSSDKSSLPSLKDLVPPKFDISIDQFG